MPFSQTFQIGAYIPALSDEQTGKASDQLSVADGVNFAWRLGSVFSAHGGLPDRVGDVAPMLHPYSFVINDDQFVVYEGGVYQSDRMGSWSQVFSFTPAYTHERWPLDRYKWTEAYVGTRHWLCHPLIGLVYYDVHDDEWGIFREDCWTGPTYAVTQADNRLVVLLEDTVVWSAFDEGHVFSCDWHCGTGAQSLALVKYGQPYTVMPYQNGWLTFTSMGIMVSMPEYAQNIDPDFVKLNPGVVIFKHEEVSFEEMPVGPTAVEHFDESIVYWLSRKGFRQFSPSQGGGSGVVRPVFEGMSDFYSEYAIKYANNAPQDHFMLNMARDIGWLFVSSRDDPADLHYARAHVYQTGLDRWGSFDHEHLHVGRARRSGINNIEFMHYGYINAGSRFVYVDHSPPNRSWIRFSPMRLQLPQEEIPATTICSIEQVRLGRSRPPWNEDPTFGLQSNWLTRRRAVQHPTRCAVYLSGGWDSETQNVDEGRALLETVPGQNTGVYVGHVTGITHSLVLKVENTGDYYDVSSVEMSYFFAGQK